jgi:putative membrane protein
VGEPGTVLPQHQIRRTRTGGLWVAVTAAAVVLLLLLIFILQNGRQVQVSFFGADGHLPLGVAMLLSAVAGALLVALLGTARIVQLRMVARRHRSADATAGRWLRRRRSTSDTSDTGPVQRWP